MQIKKFEGENVQEVLRMIKKEMGPDVYIVSTRTLRPTGIKGMWEKPRIEVSAAVDYVPEKMARTSSAHSAASAYMDAGLADEVRELKELVSGLLTSQKKGPEKAESTCYDRLMAAGLDDATANEISKKVQSSTGNDPEKLVFDALAGVVDTAGDISRSKEKAAIFIGPTGVGKTTTIAKLAALLTFREGLKVGLITLDTYRIAAVEQLGTYAKIMDVPIQALSSPRELGAALRKFKDRDIVLIDTSGRNHRDSGQMQELEGVFNSPLPLNTYLILSATTTTEGLKDAIDNYRHFPINSLVFTKIDEGVNFGNMFSAIAHSGKPLAYLTTGQRVPEDIEPATRERVASLVLDRRAC